MATHRVAWKNDKHAAQWTATLETYAYPLLGELSIQAVDTTLVMKVIEPIWAEKTGDGQSGPWPNRNPFSIGPPCAVIAKAKTRRGGGGTATSFCRLDQRCAKPSTTARCLTPNCPRS